MPERRDVEALFLDNLEWIDRAAAALCRRHGLSVDEAEEFASWVRVRLMEDDYATLRKFRGESTLTTYLTVVLAMLFRDYRVHRWGRWRPSAAARRAGPLAVRLETLVHRDGYRLEQAGEILRTSGQTERSDRELATLAGELPARGPVRPVEVGPAPPEGEAGGERADSRVLGREADEERRRAEARLAEAMATLPAEDRVILRMRFWEGLSVADVARALNLPQKPLYRRIDRCLTALRRCLEEAGVTREAVDRLLDESAP